MYLPLSSRGMGYQAQEEVRPASFGLRTENSIKTFHTNFEVEREESEENEDDEVCFMFQSLWLPFLLPLVLLLELGLGQI